MASGEVDLGSASAYGFNESNLSYNGTYTYWVDKSTGTILNFTKEYTLKAVNGTQTVILRQVNLTYDTATQSEAQVSARKTAFLLSLFEGNTPVVNMSVSMDEGTKTSAITTALVNGAKLNMLSDRRVLAASLEYEMTPSSSKDAKKTAEDSISDLKFYGTTIPVLLVILAVALLIIAIYLFIRKSLPPKDKWAMAKEPGQKADHPEDKGSDTEGSDTASKENGMNNKNEGGETGSAPADTPESTEVGDSSPSETGPEKPPEAEEPKPPED